MGHIETDREKRVAQILATDTTREQLADALWCAEDCVRHLVERTSLLNDRISKLRAEFDRMDKWHSAELVAETDENRKLRELVADMWCELAMACAEQVTSHETLRKVSDRMREMGIEASR